MTAPPRVVGIVAAAHRDDAVAAARQAADELLRRGVEVLLAGDDRGDVYRRADLLLVLGGDGTVVATARDASVFDTPVIGINFGTFGFLTEIEAHQTTEALDALVAGDYEVEERMMLEVRVDGARSWTASNDVAVTAADRGRVLDLLVSADGHALCEYPADGLIVATPTGSTAYSLSAGGPVVAPSLDAILLTPICPHTLAVRPLVVGAELTLRVEVGEVPRMSRSGVVSVDGQIHLDLLPGAGLEVRRAAQRMRLARLRPSMFFDSLRQKLRWGSPK